MATTTISKEDIMEIAKRVYKKQADVFDFKQLKYLWDGRGEPFSYDAEYQVYEFPFKTNKLSGAIYYAPKYSDYQVRLNVLGTGRHVVFHENENGVIFYFPDGDYGRDENYTENDVMECFHTIYQDFERMIA